MTRIFISAGETSGDEHAAQVVHALKQKSPDIEFLGMGGSKMRAAGANTIVDAEVSASVMGFGAVIKNLGTILEALKTLKQALETEKPDLLIVCDYPDFHFRLIKHAKKLGIPVLYYITPSIWAWRSGRVEFIKKYVDKAAVIFPFERAFFEKNNYKESYFVGNPLVEEIEKHRLSEQELSAYCARNKLDPRKRLVTIFPGSRKQEIIRNSRALFGAFQKLREKYNLQAIVPLASNINEQDLLPHIPDTKEIVFTKENSLFALQAAEVGVLKSGTSNIQAAFFHLPFFMFYSAPIITEIIVRSFVRVKEYSMVNIVRPGTIKELVSYRARESYVTKELENLLENESARNELRKSLQQVSHTFSSSDEHAAFDGCNTPAERVAALASQLLETR